MAQSVSSALNDCTCMSGVAAERIVILQFMNGESFQVPVKDNDNVLHLVDFAKTRRPPPKASSCLKLMTADGCLLSGEQLLAPLVGTVVTAVYSTCKLSYLQKNIHVQNGALVLVEEGDANWSKDIGKKAFVKRDRWVPAPCGGVVNLARASEGVTVTASSNIFDDPEMLNNVLRLGSQFGEPRYMPKVENTFVFSREDRHPELLIDFGRTVVLTRFGSAVYGRFINAFMEVACSEDADSETATWEVWGTDRIMAPDYTSGIIFFDHAPTKVRLARIRVHVTSGDISFARFGAVFAYGFRAGVGATCRACRDRQSFKKICDYLASKD